MNQITFQATGTTWQIDVNQSISDSQCEVITKKVRDRIEEFENNYSRFRENSLLNQMSKNTGEYKLPDDAKNLFDTYKKLYDLSNGLITPLIGQTLSDAGYDARYSLQEKEFSKYKKWEEVIEYNFPQLTIKTARQLDLGGIGKGYIIDIIGELLEENSISNFCIDAGGDILRKSNTNEPIRIGLENPDNTEQIIGIYQLNSGALCGSAGNRRKWNKFHHILNPKTNEPVSTIKAVWATATSATIADAMTTGLFFIDPSILSANFQFEYLMIMQDNTINKSSGFNCEIYYAKSTYEKD